MSAMTDDPRDILKAAGVECAEVEVWGVAREDRLASVRGPRDYAATHIEFVAEFAILALARLAAKYKWRMDEAINLTASSDDDATDLLEEVEQGWRVEQEVSREDPDA